jgi:hypothetical protein
MTLLTHAYTRTDCSVAVVSPHAKDQVKANTKLLWIELVIFVVISQLPNGSKHVDIQSTLAKYRHRFSAGQQSDDTLRSIRPVTGNNKQVQGYKHTRLR